MSHFRMLSVPLVIGSLAFCIASSAGAQENLDKGKTAAQLYATDCAICHKSPQSITQAPGLFGLESFLREHYTASRETATAIANYLKSMDTGPAGPGRAGKRAAKGDDKAKSGGKKKPATKPDETKGAEKNPGTAVGEPNSSEPKPAGILAPEPKSNEAKPSTPPAGESKPAEGDKKSD